MIKEVNDDDYDIDDNELIDFNVAYSPNTARTHNRNRLDGTTQRKCTRKMCWTSITGPGYEKL